MAIHRADKVLFRQCGCLQEETRTKKCHSKIDSPGGRATDGTMGDGGGGAGEADMEWLVKRHCLARGCV